jgi:DNA anti-recombination protein RmuC
MSGLPALAQVTHPSDAQAIGISITSLIGSLGAAGAAVAVTYYFLAFLRNEAQNQDRVLEEFRQYHTDSQKKFQDQLDRLADRQQQLQQAFQDQITRITESQGTLLRDAVLAMRSVEKSLEGSTGTIHGMERTVSALQASMRSIDLILHSVAKERGASQRASRPPTIKEPRHEPG